MVHSAGTRSISGDERGIEEGNQAMRNLVPQRSGNPVLRDKTFDGLATSGDAMTLDGTVNRSFALIFILLVGA